MDNKIKIQVFGSGCPTCKKFYNLVEQVVAEIGLGIEVEYVTNIQEMLEMGVMQSPVLAINGKPVIVGFVSGKEKIKQVILDSIENSQVIKEKHCQSGGCSCGGIC